MSFQALIYAYEMNDRSVVSFECSQILNWHNSNDFTGKHITINWTLGFISGYNANALSRGKPYLSFPNRNINDIAYKHVIEFCQKDISKTSVDAVINLMKTLKLR